ncbi:MAG: Type IV pilus assembly protein tapC, partial [uncultured bacterium]
MMIDWGMGKYQAYVWKGYNKWRQKVAGIIVTDSDFNAEIQAKQLDVTITYFKQRSLLTLPREAGKKIKSVDIVFTMRQLSTLISAGIPLVQSLGIMSEGIVKVRLRALL